MSRPLEKTLLDLQTLLHYETYRALLEDIKDPAKRTPALIQAALKGLSQAGIDVDPTAIPVEGSAMGQITQLAHDLPPILADNEEFDQYR